MAFDLTSRNALITGAGAANGIGMATARLLGEMGAKVYLTGASARVLDRAEELRSEGIDALASPADLTVTNEVTALASRVVDHFGGLDILVNNAGMTSVANPAGEVGETGGLAEVSVERFEQALRRNVTTTYSVTRALISSLRQSPAGRIVIVTSVTGSVMAMRGQVPYATAKAGLTGMVRALALDELASGITVNAVAPGWIATESQTPAEDLQGLGSPMGRSGTASEVASAIGWLCSREASFITGQSLIIDGGNSIAEERVLFGPGTPSIR